MRVVNLTGAKNFIDKDGTKYVSVNQDNKKVDYPISNTISKRLLPLTNSLDVPYFSLAVNDIIGDDDEELDEDSEIDTAEDDDGDFDDEDATDVDESKEAEPETEVADDVERPKTTTKKVIKVGGRAKKSEKQVSV